jgi:hypothetical protein
MKAALIRAPLSSYLLGSFTSSKDSNPRYSRDNHSGLSSGTSLVMIVLL